MLGSNRADLLFVAAGLLRSGLGQGSRAVVFQSGCDHAMEQLASGFHAEVGDLIDQPRFLRGEFHLAGDGVPVRREGPWAGLTD